MSYASTADLLKRYDARVLGDLINDSGARMSPTAIYTDPNIQAALDDASGMIDSSVLVGARYSPSDLAGLTGVDQSYLIRMVCDLAYILLVQRRGFKDAADLQQFTIVMNELEKLKSGWLVFNVASVVAKQNATSEFPSTTTYKTVDLLRDEATPRFFPERRSQANTAGGQ